MGESIRKEKRNVRARNIVFQKGGKKKKESDTGGEAPRLTKKEKNVKGKNGKGDLLVGGGINRVAKTARRKRKRIPQHHKNQKKSDRRGKGVDGHDVE